MLFVSTRKSLSNENEIGPTSYWDIPIDGNVAETSQGHAITVEDVVEQISGKSILIVVHGYNNEFEDIARAYDVIDEMVEKHLSDWYDLVVGFTWPGGENALDWNAPKRRAGIIAPRLARFIRAIASEVSTVDIMSHSLGARVVLSALTALPQDSVRANFLTASAVDNETLEPMQKYYSSVKLAAKESIVFHSKRDLVLRSAYRIAEWDNPLGLFGPENPAAIINSLSEVFVANCKNVIGAHGEYKSTPEIYEFINRWMAGDIVEQFSTL